jgi:hypothetical protein
VQLDQNDSDLVEHGAAEGGPDGQPEDADLGRAEAPEQGPARHLGGGAVAPRHAVVEPCRVAGVEVGDDGDEGHHRLGVLLLLLLPLKHPQRDVLHQRVHADDHVRLVLHDPSHHLAACVYIHLRYQMQGNSSGVAPKV